MQTIDASRTTSKVLNGKTAVKRTRSTSRAKETIHLKSKATIANPSTDELMEMIATAAYYCAERRQFEPGRELEDWLTAEREIRATFQS